MNDEQLKIFIAIAEAGSFSAAEKNSYISKQAMLKQIKNLEQEIETPLFIRSRTGIELTPAGKVFLVGSRKLLRQKDELIAKTRFASDSRQIVRIGNVEHQVLLNSVNEEFSKRYPDIELRRIVHPNHSGEWRVENDVQDVAETFFTGKKVPKCCSYIPLTESTYVAAMSLNHPLASEASISLKDLSIYETIIFEPMLKTEYLNCITDAFSNHPEYLLKRMDVDHQVEAAYEARQSKRILITANPFIYSVPEITLIPLDTGWTSEYGLLSRKDHSEAVGKYIGLAKQIYKKD